MNISELKPQDHEYFVKGVIKNFGQTEFGDFGLFDTVPLSSNGYVFYPFDCLEKQCNLHIALNGCEEGFIGGQSFILSSGYLEYAASNDLVILFATATNCHDTFEDPRLED